MREHSYDDFLRCSSQSRLLESTRGPLFLTLQSVRSGSSSRHFALRALRKGSASSGRGAGAPKGTGFRVSSYTVYTWLGHFGAEVYTGFCLCFLFFGGEGGGMSSIEVSGSGFGRFSFV